MDGKWSSEWYDTKDSVGKFVRAQSGYRSWITPDGSKGPSGEAGFAAEAGRYHLDQSQPDHPDRAGIAVLKMRSEW